MDSLAEAVLDGASAEEIEREPVPDAYVAAHLNEADTGMFQGVDDKDVRKSMQVGRVAMPELAPDEVLIAVMASSINYNTVWSATFEPVPTFAVPRAVGRPAAAPRATTSRTRSSARTRPASWSGPVPASAAGSRRPCGRRARLCATTTSRPRTPTAMLGRASGPGASRPTSAGWPHYAVVRASQLIPKPAHLTWEESGQHAC